MAFFWSEESILPSVDRFFKILRDYPILLKPFSGTNIEFKNILAKNLMVDANSSKHSYSGISSFGNHKQHSFFERIPLFSLHGFYIFPTVEHTTLFYDDTSDCFFKILHLLTFKHKILSLFLNKAKSVYMLSEHFLAKGVEVPKILAYGVIKHKAIPFFVMKKIEGKSLFQILIKEKNTFPETVFFKVIDRLISVHTGGYWFGDLRASHIFIHNNEISGFIDIDSIRRINLYPLKKIAKDLAGFNHPELPLSEDEKMKLFDYYMDKSNIRNGNKRKLLCLIKHYTKRRWKL